MSHKQQEPNIDTDPSTLDWNSITNTHHNSCKSVECKCETWFELHQQTAIKVLSNHIEGSLYKLEQGYEERAKRIAAIYARIFLEFNFEDEIESDTVIEHPLLGRFYWMGLGAFASKTVANFFDDFFISLGYDGPFDIARDAVDILAKGNLWLAMDIIPWHLAWASDKEGFKKCMNERDFAEFKNLKPAIDSLPWASSVPNMLRFPKDENGKPTKDSKQLGITTEIDNAFNTYLKKIEEIFNKPNNAQLPTLEKLRAAESHLSEHLMQIAVQEQRNILQTLCWDEETMKQVMKIQRGIEGVQKIMMKISPLYSVEFLPNPTLILTSDYALTGTKIAWHSPMDNRTNTLPEEPWSSPLPDTIIENYDSRMEWIVEAAKKYHRLMLDDNGHIYLIEELKKIANWHKAKINPIYLHRNSNEGKT